MRKLARSAGPLRVAAVAVLAALAGVATGCSSSGPNADPSTKHTGAPTTKPCPPAAPGADLANCDLSNTNLIGADLSGANLKNTDLQYSNLTGANLSHAQLYGTHFTGANFSGATINDAQINPVMGRYGPVNSSSGAGQGANFTGADLSGSSITANLTAASFVNANLGGTPTSPYFSFSESNLTDANFTGAHLTGAEIVLSNLTGANFTGVDLSAVAVWTNDICPNGSNSDDDGDTCAYSMVGQ
jgi:uncharacterized protein YjbI with pentapeptide repeats